MWPNIDNVTVINSVQFIKCTSPLCYDWPSALSNDVDLIFEYFMVSVSRDQRAEQQGCLLPGSPLNWPEEMYVSSMCLGTGIGRLQGISRFVTFIA